MLLNALNIIENNEVISLVGAGGKTSFMYALARELSSLQRRVLITTTTHLKKPTGKAYELMILENCPKRAANKINQIFDASNVAFWADNEVSDGKIRGLSMESIDIIADMGIADNILIEADGSKGLPIKAPAYNEPVIPKKTTILIGVIGIDALGRTIDDKTVHRPEFLSMISGKPLGGIIDEAVIQNLIFSPYGLFKGATEQMKKVVVINKVDNNQILDLAIKLAESIKNVSNIEIFRILLTSFNCETSRIKVIL
ncbi:MULTISPECIES: selenium cofactor biosynthesis protein YqeC [Tepidanaerobacter]|nr:MULTISPECIES: selenium cofactor biosynthesis protein YqeC [Tepidanaerobacter]